MSTRVDPLFRRQVYRFVLGIETGDMVRTSYGSGPYEVWAILGPAYWELDYAALCVRDHPVMSLILVHPGIVPEWEHELFYINELACENGRYSSGSGEVFVEKPDHRPPMELPGLTADEDYEVTGPYQFQEGVDYRAGNILAGDERVWHCKRCGTDFNAESQTADSAAPPICPRCGWPAALLIVLFRGDCPTGQADGQGQVEAHEVTQ